MKELRRIKKELHKSLNETYKLILKDRTEGVPIDWEIRIKIVTTNGETVITTIDEVTKVFRHIN